MKKYLIYVLALMLGLSCSDSREAEEKPNFLWITCEDISPYLGCYGDAFAQTPNLDELAARGIRYTRAYANAPVCGVARSTLLTGMYATTTGTHQMRARTRLPDLIPAYPKILRKEGYYCTNNSKRDYNSSFEKDTTLWDESSREAHWRNRPEEKPFFAVFNLTMTHESQLQERAIAGYVERGEIPEVPRVDPDLVELPPYHPDLPLIRNDWARLHDLITRMDEVVGELLKEIQDEGLSENTIVVFNSDHGGMLSRSKRFIYNVGTQVPLIVYLPEKWQHLAGKEGGKTEDRLVSFIDFPKTFLSICGAELPDLMQGSVFLGDEVEEDPGYVHFFRDRMAGRNDFSRAVTDGRYYYIRNFTPTRPNGRDSRYGNTVQANWNAWEDHFEAGLCNEIQSQFYSLKPPVQFFDTQLDPWQVDNLARDPGMEEKIQELADELDRWMLETRDVGLIPEAMYADLAGPQKAYGTIYEFAQSPDYNIARILPAAQAASRGEKALMRDYLNFMQDADPVIRYWGAYGLFLSKDAEPESQDALKIMAADDEMAVNRLMAAQALGLCGDPARAFSTIMTEVNATERGYVFLQGINAFQYSMTDDRLTRADWLRFEAREWPEELDQDPFGHDYAGRIISDALELWPERRKVY